RRWQRGHAFALVFGTMLGSMLAGFIGFLGAARADLSFKILVDLLAVALMLALGSRIRRSSKPGAEGGTQGVSGPASGWTRPNGARRRTPAAVALPGPIGAVTGRPGPLSDAIRRTGHAERHLHPDPWRRRQRLIPDDTAVPTGTCVQTRGAVKPASGSGLSS